MVFSLLSLLIGMINGAAALLCVDTATWLNQLFTCGVTTRAN